MILFEKQSCNVLDEGKSKYISYELCSSMIDIKFCVIRAYLMMTIFKVIDFSLVVQLHKFFSVLY